MQQAAADVSLDTANFASKSQVAFAEHKYYQYLFDQEYFADAIANGDSEKQDQQQQQYSELTRIDETKVR